MWLAAIAVICVSMILLLSRVLLGPSAFDRLLAVNLFGTNLVVLISLLAYIKGTESYIDIALVYAFLNFVAIIGFLRYFKYGSFRGKHVVRKRA